MPYRTPEAAVSPVAAPEPEAASVPEPVPTASIGTHPLAISPEEGLPLIPQDELLRKLNALASLKLGALQMYAVFGDAIRSPYRDSLYAHFEEHAKEEREGVYDLNMKIIALGGALEPKTPKLVVTQGVQQLLTQVIQTEKALIKALRELIAASGEYAGLRLMLEDNLLKDQKHLDDARRMLMEVP